MFRDKTALVIGASKKNPENIERWDSYFEPKNTEWIELPDYITRNLKLDKGWENLSPQQLLDKTYDLYQSYYASYLQKLPNLDCIMLDRATTHGLIIDMPFAIPDGREQNVSFYALMKSNYLTREDTDGTIGAFNKHILCLLFLNLLTKLKDNGDLVLDTAYLDPKHIEILSNCFNRCIPFNFNAAENAVLNFAPTYAGGNYLKPAFLQFCQLKPNLKIDFSEVKNQLIALSFDLGNKPARTFLISNAHQLISSAKFDMAASQAFYGACAAGQLQAIKDLLLKRADINTVGQDPSSGHCTGLQLAVLNGHTQVVHYLLQQPGINLSHRDVRGKTAIQLALDNAKFDLAEMISALPLNQRLLNAAAGGQLQEVQQALQEGADVNTINSKANGNYNALQLAIVMGRTEVIGPLVAAGADLEYAGNLVKKNALQLTQANPAITQEINVAMQQRKKPGNN